MEKEAISRVIDMAAIVGVPVYIVHVSTKEAMEVIKQEKKGVRLSMRRPVHIRLVLLYSNRLLTTLRMKVVDWMLLTGERSCASKAEMILFRKRQLLYLSKLKNMKSD